MYRIIACCVYNSDCFYGPISRALLINNIIKNGKDKKSYRCRPQGKLSPGEYTGRCRITGLHCVSFYNGYVRRFRNILDILFEHTKIKIRIHEKK